MKLSGDKLFFTLQGEGITQGQPAIFVRLAGCNLSCGYCDAYYTWAQNEERIKFAEKQYKNNTGKELPQYLKMVNPSDEIVNVSPLGLAGQIREMSKKTSCKKVIWSGGEPLMQQKEINDVFSLLPKEFTYYSEVETNGTIAFDRITLSNINHISCSPKLLSSGNSNGIVKPVLQQIAKHKSSIFKFVVTTEDDINDINSVVKENDLPTNKVWLMPEGVTVPSILEKLPWIAEYCKAYGYGLSPRIQIFCFGNKRAT